MSSKPLLRWGNLESTTYFSSQGNENIGLLLDSSIHFLIWGHQSICRLSFPNFQPEKTMAHDALRELWKGSPLSLQKLDGETMSLGGWLRVYVESGSVAVWTCRSLWSLITLKKFICRGIPPFFRVCHIDACIVILMNRGKQVFFSTKC